MPFTPATQRSLDAYRQLVATAARVEGDAAALAGAVTASPEVELVAWAWTVDSTRAQVLLIDHHRHGVWMPPGGRVEADEDPAVAAARELVEETGVVGRLVDASAAFMDVARWEAPAGRLSFGVAFVFEADPEAVVLGEVGQPAAWWPLDASPPRAEARHWQRLGECFR